MQFARISYDACVGQSFGLFLGFVLCHVKKEETKFTGWKVLFCPSLFSQKQRNLKQIASDVADLGCEQDLQRR